MISILIPVFNRNVYKLVFELSNQVTLSQQQAEIIVMDDGSEASYQQLHRALIEIPFVRYIDSDKNNGRVRIRQMLAGLASFEWLLFLDCDSFIISDRFLENYYRQITDAGQVIVGGRVYAAERPAECGLRLHWKYGTAREKTIPGLQGYVNRFMTNNFLIRKSIFKKFVFAEEWKGYGYEDTWMAIQLEEMNVPINYINNPVQHDGLEEALVFLSKSREALRNLKRLSSTIPQKLLIKHVKLYGYFYRLQSWRLLGTVRLTYIFLHSITRKNLQSCNPSLWIFDLYRLNYFVRLNTITKADPSAL